MKQVRIRYDRLSYQERFHESLKPKVYLSTGYGGGKTYSLVMKTLKLAKINRGLPGGLLVPTLKMFKRDVLPTFKEICGRYRIKVDYKKQDSELHIPGLKTLIYIFHSEDDGESIKGPNLAYMSINEVTLCSELAFKSAIARVRLKRAPLKQVAMSGTPEGFNWAYDYFVATQREDTDLIFGDMRENTHVDEGYAQMLLDSYDAVMAKQYVEGQFVNLNAMAAVYGFNRHKHTDESIRKEPGLPVWVSCDFNVNPMAATLWNRMPLDSGHILRAFDEIKIDSASTYDLAKAIKSKIDIGDEVVLFPDPAGASRSTKSNGHTDISILEESGFSDIRYKTRIKSVRDCLNAANNLFSRDKLVLNSRTCRHTIQDLEQTVLKPGTGELDKSDIRRTHWVDGIKNMIEYEFPIEVKRGTWRQERIR